MRKIRLTWEDTQKGPLILVTPDHPLSDVWKPGRMVPVMDGFPIFLEEHAAKRLGQLLKELGNHGQIVPVSGFRSHEEQISIWEDTLQKEGEAFTRTYVAKPGHSEHESGLAIDLAKNRDKIDFIRPDFPRDGICGQFRKKAADYGFVERYPAGKEALTGIGAEPWHFRYVGSAHGRFMDQEGMILEEYIAFLKENTSPDHPYRRIFWHERAYTEIFYIDMRGRAEWLLTEAEGERIFWSGSNEGGIILCRQRKRYG